MTFSTKNPQIKYWLFSYLDLFGYQRSKLVPASAVESMIEIGAGFAGFASWLDLSPADGDLMAIPDLESAIILPWKKEVKWVACDLFLDDKPLKQSPRYVLKKLISQINDIGYEMKTGVEAEFFLLDETGKNISDLYDQSKKPCYDQMCLMRRYEVISEICDHLNELGWEPYQNDHEDANGQFEINWKYDQSLRTADKHNFFKFLVKSVAQKHGFRATFMPKPFKNLTGNGCHSHISCWDLKSDHSAFTCKNSDYLSELGFDFLSGILNHAESISAILNPTVNSYRRTQADTTSSGSTWAPRTISWTNNNRTHMVRVPENGRFELRLADGAVNPYLLQAAILAAGILGIENKYGLQDISLGDNTIGDGFNEKRLLPANLGESLTKLDEDEVFKEKIGEDFIRSYLKLKEKEWQEYLSFFTDWEVKNTLDI